MYALDPELMDKAGIYRITNLVDGRATTYIGSAMNSFRQRLWAHSSSLRCGVHANSHLQAAYGEYGEYGEDAFTFEVLEVLPSTPVLMLEREQAWLDRHLETGRVYNLVLDVAASPMTGRCHTEEAKDLLAISYPALFNTRTQEKVPAGRNVSRFCRERGLPRKQLYSMLKRRCRSCHGWILATDLGYLPQKQKDYRGTLFFNSRTQEIAEVTDTLSAFCREHQLHLQAMQDSIQGRMRHHRDWELYVAVIDGEIIDGSS